MGGIAIDLNIAGTPPGGVEVRRRLGLRDARSRIIILNGHGDGWRARSSGGQFSVKWAPKGRVRYGTEGARHLLGPRGLLLMNAGQPYAMDFDGAAQTFCVFYSDDLVREAWAVRDALDLDAAGEVAEFPNLVFRPGAAFQGWISGLYADIDRTGDWPTDVEARLLMMLSDAVAAAKRHRGETARAPAVKATTRRHILARLEVARCLIADGEGHDLDTVARACGLSKFHLVRLFGRVFGCTPMKYAEHLRLDRAAEALRTSRRLIEEIAFEAGYESLGAFSRAFRRRFEATPRMFRAGSELAIPAKRA